MNKMVKMALLALAFAFVSCTTDADDDSDDWSAAEVCPENGTNAYGDPNRGTFVDERDGRVYKYTTIGDQVWMAENLKYEAENSECYDIFEDNCRLFGRLYSLMDDSLLNYACPKGWHLPVKEEWELLISRMGAADAATRMKSKKFWGIASKIGSDDCALAIYPSAKSGLFYYAVLASSTQDGSLGFVVFEFENEIYQESSQHDSSIRCVKDN